MVVLDPIKPCYKDSQCYNNYNCGGTTPCREEDSVKCGEESTRQKGLCYGYDKEYCSGVLTTCSNDAPFDCDNNTKCFFGDIHNNTGGISINGVAETLCVGCQINDPNYAGDTPLGVNTTSCVEFNNNIDIISDCDVNCWTLGGKNIVDKQCEQLGLTNCASQPYFCEEKNGFCKAVDTDPYDRFDQLYNNSDILKHGPSVIPIKKECEDGTKNITCIENPRITSDQVLTCSQSAWDTTKQTSLDPRTRICCINDEADKCIVTPRCQHVDTSCECTERDGKFMCAPSLINFVNRTGGVTRIVQELGYCTWCQGQSTPPYEVNHTLPPGVKEKEPYEWFEGGNPNNTCINKCGGYNECSVSNSEFLWNSCVYEESGGSMGVSQEDLDKESTEEAKLELLKRKGYCSKNDIEKDTNDKTVGDRCIDKLSYLKTVSNSDTTSPGGSNISACNEYGKWNLSCNLNEELGSQSEDYQYAENFFCTWCPSLQCDSKCKDSNDCTKCCESPPKNNQAMVIGLSVTGSVVGVAGIAGLAIWLSKAAPAAVIV